MTRQLESTWQTLKRFTQARVAQGRSGVSMPTQPNLAFQLAHARARDAVHQQVNWTLLEQQLSELTSLHPQFFAAGKQRLHSQAQTRAHYLQRPDLGRRLNQQAVESLNSAASGQEPYDLVVVLADGLSATALHSNAVNLLEELANQLQGQHLRLAPICLVEQGRVAIADEIAQTVNAKASLILIGERPGLSSPDSLGLYFTWHPQLGLTDERRNCVSNIRQAGLSYAAAAEKFVYLFNEAQRIGSSGICIKDRSEQSASLEQQQATSFLSK